MREARDDFTFIAGHFFRWPSCEQALGPAVVGSSSRAVCFQHHSMHELWHVCTGAAKICKILCCVSFYFSPLLVWVIFTAAGVSVWPRCFNQVLLCCKLIIAFFPPVCLWALWVVFNITGHHLMCLLVSIYRWLYQYFCSLFLSIHKNMICQH